MQAGSGPVAIATCNNGANQQIVVEEINAQHEVVLHAGQKVIGVHPPLVVTTGNAPLVSLTDRSLELQAPARPIDPAFRNQVFSLDGEVSYWPPTATWWLKPRTAAARAVLR